MCGVRRAAGAVAALTGIRSPILAARAVMDSSEHVLLVGPDATDFAARCGLEQRPPAWFVTAGRQRQLDRALDLERVVRDHDLYEEEDDAPMDKGTVGAVALDRDGHLAAATSTGGMTAKLPGRVGDSALIGAGTWALDTTCAVSATGHGEAFIRHHVAGRVSDLVELAGLGLEAACARVLAELPPESGGLIAVDARGQLCLPMNCGGMYRAWMRTDGERGTAIW